MISWLHLSSCEVWSEVTMAKGQWLTDYLASWLLLQMWHDQDQTWTWLTWPWPDHKSVKHRQVPASHFYDVRRVGPEATKSAKRLATETWAMMSQIQYLPATDLPVVWYDITSKSQNKNNQQEDGKSTHDWTNDSMIDRSNCQCPNTLVCPTSEGCIYLYIYKQYHNHIILLWFKIMF